MDKQQIIHNVVNLDIRTATEEAVARIKRVDNAVNLLYSPQTAALVGRLNIGNVVNPIEVPAGARLHQGPLALNRDLFKGQTAPLCMVVMGPLTVEPDVSADEIERGVGYLNVYGPVLCPEQVAGVLEAKIKELHGPLYAYPAGCKLNVGDLDLDERFLRALDENTTMMVAGRLNARDVLPNDLLRRKVAKIMVTNGVVCRGENAEVLLPRLESKMGPGRVTVIPAGHEMVRRALLLTPALLEALPARKLYCTEVVRIAENVTPQLLDRSLEALVAKEMLICPVALQEVMLKKIDVFETEAIFYEGKLWLVDGETTLSAAHLGYLENKTTLIVTGKLKIEPDIAPKALVDGLIKVYNLGRIEGSAEQVAALEFRLASSGGDLCVVSPEQPSAPEQPGEDAYEIDNIVNLKL